MFQALSYKLLKVLVYKALSYKLLKVLVYKALSYAGEDHLRMQAYQAKHGVNITTRNGALRVGSRDACSDVLSMLDDLRLSRADFVVLKFGTN